VNIKQKIEYWNKIAENDLPVMEHLFDSGDYSYSLYIGHLILEKIIKALFVKTKHETPPRIHDLVKLSSTAEIELDDEQIKFLLIVNTFNIEARYPEEKLNFYKICTKEFASENILKINEMYQWLKSLL